MIATIDISRWYAGGGAEADAVAAELDEGGLQQAGGFILVTGHGIDPQLAADVRAASRRFFSLPDESSAGTPCQSAATAGSLPVRKRTPTPRHRDAAGPQGELQLGAETAVGDPEIDRIWFAPNVWPDEVAELRPLVDEYTAAVRRLADDLLA